MGKFLALAVISLNGEAWHFIIHNKIAKIADIYVPHIIVGLCILSHLKVGFFLNNGVQRKLKGIYVSYVY